MNLTEFVFVLVTLGVATCEGDINVADYIYWKKEDINRWNLFFPLRSLEQERLTIEAATEAISSLSNFLEESLWKIVAFQSRELETAKQLTAGTNAEGCINGISSYLDNAILKQMEAYQDCTADSQSKISLIKKNWIRINNYYQGAYQRAMTGIDACAKTYPNKDSINRLRSCVESMNNNYFLAANNTQNSVNPSPSMTYFQNNVVKCASAAAQTVAAKGSQFLRMLVSCAALSDIVDPTEYAQDLSKWTGYNDTLAEQIIKSQSDYAYQISNVENTLIKYYQLQKQALEEYVIESRGLDFYLKKIYSYLYDYYNTVTATSLDNPGNPGCTATAKSMLDNVANIGAATSLACDQAIVNDTKYCMVDIYDDLFYVSNQTTSIGNVAVLKCFVQGFVYAPNTIRDCYLLSSAEFHIEFTDRNQSSSESVQKIEYYLSSLFTTPKLPCGDSVLNRIFLGADKALYDLKRCLYSSSGTNYEVTTPITEAATTTISNNSPA